MLTLLQQNMIMAIKKILILLLMIDLLLFVKVANSSTLPPQANIEQQVNSELDNFLSSESFQKFKHKHFEDANGVISMELVVNGRRVETIFVDSSNVQPVAFVNSFSNFIKEMNFDFRLPKGQRQKIKHQFIIKK